MSLLHTRTFRRVYQRVRLMVLIFLSLYLAILLFFPISSSGMGWSREVGIKWGNIIPPDGELIKKVVIPRAVGSTGHKRVQSTIISHFTSLKWHVHLDRFKVENTPIVGRAEFTNIIVTMNPSASKRIILAAHYDSKLKIKDDYGNEIVGGFVGATDSGWPCVLLMELARSLTQHHIRDKEKTLQIVFFDGEEAFEEWTRLDSIYGARHLADLWKVENKLISIEYLMLLDLLGSADTHIPIFFPSTMHKFKRLSSIERMLSSKGLIKQRSKAIFDDQSIINTMLSNGDSWLEDDHIPFMKLQVPILHLISFPFPAVWHKNADNVDALDPIMCHDISLILWIFIREELGRNEIVKKQ